MSRSYRYRVQLLNAQNTTHNRPASPREVPLHYQAQFERSRFGSSLGLMRDNWDSGNKSINPQSYN